MQMVEPELTWTGRALELKARWEQLAANELGRAWVGMQ